MRSCMNRRQFLARVSEGAAALGLGCRAVGATGAATATQPAGPEMTIRDLPKKPLGRTGYLVGPLSIGLAGMGHAFFTPEEYEPVVHAAIDAGLTYLDIAPNYDVSEERLGPVMEKRRREVFLAGKTEAPSRDGTLRLIERSLRRMRTDRLDLGHLHNVGQFETAQILGKDGMLDGLRTARDRGLIRFIGATGHQNPSRFIPVLETGEIDVLMVVINFVDRHIYDFERRVLPLARKKGTAIVAMKVLGGVQGGWDGYAKRLPGRLIGPMYTRAIRYAMSVPGVVTMVLGIKSIEELRQAIRAVREYKPFTPAEAGAVEEQGRELAGQWGEHFGPAT